MDFKLKNLPIETSQEVMEPSHYLTLIIMLIGPCNVDPPYTPLSYSKTGVYRGIHCFLIFALKQRLWILVRTAERTASVVLTCTHNLCF